MEELVSDCCEDPLGPRYTQLVVPGRTAQGPARWLLGRPQQWLAQVRWATLDLSGPYRAA